MEEERKPILEELNELRQLGKEPSKIKELKLLRKAKVRKRKAKKGWIGIIKVDNGIALGEKQKVEGSTIKLKDGTYHSLEEGESILWKGKFPVVFQWKGKILNLAGILSGKDETYDQKYIMARMRSDVIKEKGKGGFSGLIWIVVIVGIGYGIGKLLHLF
jgi:hypothetical protein